MDLDIIKPDGKELEEDKEETEGGFLAVNDDDDNEDNTSDLLNISKPITNENDLVRIRLKKIEPDSIKDGTVTISATQGETKIKVWQVSGGAWSQVAITGSNTTKWNLSQLPIDLWVEGITSSDKTRDVELRLIYKPTQSSSYQFVDKVRLTVVKVEFKETAPNNGFDESIIPPWLIVPRSGTNTAKVEITPLIAVPDVYFKSNDTGIATVIPSNATSSPQIVTVTGVEKGETEIISPFRSINGNSASTLQISVKTRRPVKVSFHFISDSSGTATTRSTTIVDDLIKKMNEIWGPQANVYFEKKTVDSPTVPIDMGDVVRFSSHLPGVLASEHEWDDVIAMGDSSADVNVFFVWEYESDDTPLVDNVAGAYQSKNILFEDNTAYFAEALAHEMGHHLEITPADYKDPTKSNELMYAYNVGGTKIRKAQADQANK